MPERSTPKNSVDIDVCRGKKGGGVNSTDAGSNSFSAMPWITNCMTWHISLTGELPSDL